MALPLYAVTLFISAFILFLIQPMIGKMLLPKLGGTPQVWNTCMVFFQMVLLAGYAYTHTISTRLKLRQQLILHGVMLFIPFLVLFAPLSAEHLPFNIYNWIPTLGANPIPSTLWILIQTVALPFLVVATSAPLLQKWFISTGHPAAKDPYFLYGASNLGSMLSLILYPFLIEPFTSISNQSLLVIRDGSTFLSQPWIWVIGYIVLLLFVIACAALVWSPSGIELKSGARIMPERDPHLAPVPSAETAITSTPPRHPDIAHPAPPVHAEITGMRRLRWVLLAAVPSSLMLGVTTFITTDLSPIPLFWLIPLTLYLASFIFVFARWPVVWVEKPHVWMLVAQPIAIALMLFFGYINVDESKYLWPCVIFYVVGFFLTTMVCHGELAKDRPSTRYLTEFYLWMSVGGMVGGMFNGLVAPVVFKWGVLEFGIAILAACLLRPRLREGGWLDDMLAGVFEPAAAPVPAPVVPQRGKQAHAPRPHAVATPANPAMSKTLDYVIPLIMLVVVAVLAFGLGSMLARTARSSAQEEMVLFVSYGLPLAACCFLMNRPVRFGLAIGAIMVVHWLVGHNEGGSESLYQNRSYFGLINVKEDRNREFPAGGERVKLTYRRLIHGHIDHGMNFTVPERKNIGNPDRDFSRHATTYYHRLGPAGRVMEMPKFNPLPGPMNTYWGDVCVPTTIFSQVAAQLMMGGGVPVDVMVQPWAAPPYATVGLGTGTMAGYARPFQHMHFYEIDNQVRRLSLPEDGDELYFNYISQAKQRGAEVQVLMGDARLRMNLPYYNFAIYEKRSEEQKAADNPFPPGGPENFYHMMVVDAFSSDAIPAHLITLEAIEMYFKHLTEDGILCVHTSNRFVELPKVVKAVADKLKFVCARGHDQAPDPNSTEIGHYTSEWVMVARKDEYLEPLRSQAAFLRSYEQLLQDQADKHDARKPVNPGEAYWGPIDSGPRFLWTDDFTNLWAVIRPWRR